ncbi:hypothetical protein BDP27DRAFT_1285543 [Rhodocollybia butyracea]|uniref:Uncharacterized protein n=1 Tax=Rhodocollybia butyracea TaxID=206335 RepID=A0A9P5Q7W7_9AGAR|nr:hypothetical protein BDP27DRAFT_1285543 [Rhodocollybia butyracea]
MSKHDLQVLDTFETADYLKGELSDEELDIPQHMVPPNPDDSDNLPSHVHPSYPYGNPISIKHPASRPRPPYDPTSRALFEDMGYDGNGVAGTLRWKDLALDQLLPVDEEKELAIKAAEARKMASGTGNQNPQGQQPTALAQGEETLDEDEDDENDENDDEEEEEDEDEEGSDEED